MADFKQLVSDQKLSREKVFRCPVHDYIHINDQIILDLIDTPEFQRLRRIHQLGTSSYTFHGAEHTRFGHCMGVYEITRRIINKFQRNYPSKEKGDGYWDESERMVALCSALLHDIGHGPFSHTFEGIFDTNHEEVTCQIILSPDTEVNKVLRRLGDDFPEKVTSVINHTYPNQQVVQLISSQIDADRMDYLLRDAFYAGVSYGEFDLTRILRVIRPYKGKIYFDYSGMHAIEDYIVSRHQMYMQVYFHPNSRGMEVLLKRLLERAKYLYNQNRLKQALKPLEAFLENDWTLDDYLKLDDGVMTTQFSIWTNHEDSVLSDLADRFLNRRIFKSIICTDAEKEEMTIALREVLYDNGYHPDYYLGLNSSYDLPYDYYQPFSKKQSNQIPIELVTKTDQIVELSQVSPLVSALAGKERGDQRLYMPGELLNLIISKEPSERTENEIKIYQAYINEANDVTYHSQERLF